MEHVFRAGVFRKWDTRVIGISAALKASRKQQREMRTMMMKSKMGMFMGFLALLVSANTNAVADSNGTQMDCIFGLDGRFLHSEEVRDEVHRDEMLRRCIGEGQGREKTKLSDADSSDESPTAQINE